ncbi:hypothetical protein [Streptomyces scabiei]|uniref:hypothetical protein n=1 Tax=Streptomyces scabiei TaxID=1930 RepID=UPI001B301592|nr:hypothetical protein [Streptomyces sp. LBUM 1475]QTU64235.1 hypothetical protein F3K22_27355 [Streptomyces sp. LBUM 1475]
MKLIMAALCDRATIREGLLHILGAGVTQCSLASLPSAPDLDLAVLIRAENLNELAGRHTLTTTVTHEGGALLGRIEMIWESPQIEPSDETAKAPCPRSPS